MLDFQIYFLFQHKCNKFATLNGIMDQRKPGTFVSRVSPVNYTKTFPSGVAEREEGLNTNVL